MRFLDGVMVLDLEATSLFDLSEACLTLPARLAARAARSDVRFARRIPSTA